MRGRSRLRTRQWADSGASRWAARCRGSNAVLIEARRLRRATSVEMTRSKDAESRRLRRLPVHREPSPSPANRRHRCAGRDGRAAGLATRSAQRRVQLVKAAAEVVRASTSDRGRAPTAMPSTPLVRRPELRRQQRVPDQRMAPARHPTGASRRPPLEVSSGRGDGITRRPADDGAHPHPVEQPDAGRTAAPTSPSPAGAARHRPRRSSPGRCHSRRSPRPSSSIKPTAARSVRNRWW